MAEPTRKLTRRAIIDLSRVTRVTVRGVEWVSDGYMMVRADMLRTVPKDGKDAMPIPAKAARRVLDTSRDGVRLADSFSCVLTDASDRKARFIGGSGRMVALNPDAADEWLSQKWDAITQGATPPVVFWQKRRGKLTPVGVIMPMHIGFGIYKATTISAVGAVDEVAA